MRVILMRCFFIGSISLLIFSDMNHAFNLPVTLKSFHRLDNACQYLDKTPSLFIQMLEKNHALARWLNTQVSEQHTAWNLLLINNSKKMLVIHMHHSQLYKALRHWANYTPFGLIQLINNINIEALNDLCNTAPITKDELMHIFEQAPSGDFFNLHILLNTANLRAQINNYNDSAVASMINAIQPNSHIFSNVFYILVLNSFSNIAYSLLQFIFAHVNGVQYSINVVLGMQQVIQDDLQFVQRLEQSTLIWSFIYMLSEDPNVLPSFFDFCQRLPTPPSSENNMPREAAALGFLMVFFQLTRGSRPDI